MSVVPIGAGEGQAHVKYERLIAAAKQVPSVVTIVVHPCDEASLRGVCEAAAADIIKPILVGPAAKIKAVAAQFNFDISHFEIVDAAHSEAAAARGVELIHEGKGELLMKGSLHTDELMRSVTAKSSGLRTDRRISHVFVDGCARPTPRHCLLRMLRSTSFRTSIASVTSCKMRSISIRGSVLGVPRVAILSAVETVTAKIPSTIDAASLCKMADRGQITGGLLDGPLAFDNASTRRLPESRESNRLSPATLKSWWCRISRPATCWPKT